LIPLNKIRRDNLERVRDAARKQNKRPLVKDLVLAFVKPTLDFLEATPAAENFIALVARSFVDPDDTVRRIFMELVWPVFQLIFETFREALPGLPENVLLWRLHFMFGAFSHAMHMFVGRFHSDKIQISSHRIKIPLDSDAKSITEMFIPFITAGMEAP
jgi:hypothetical protein